MPKCFKIIFLLFAFQFSSNALAEEVTPNKPSYILVPAVSYFLPGFGSFVDGDYKTGAKFLSYGLAGLGITTTAQYRIDDFWQRGSLSFHHLEDLRNERAIGRAMTHHSKMLSLYDSFINRVIATPSESEYSFLPREQNLNSILKAPFRFEYLKRWTTFIPFTLAIVGATEVYNESPKPEQLKLRAIDGAASTYLSYVAGTGEEAFFRGWIYPMLYQHTKSHLISNAIQGTAFGYAHGPRPYIQLAFGFYTGWLTERNNFDLGEAIFIHAWWDFWVLAAEYIRSRSETKDYNFQLPLFEYRF